MADRIAMRAELLREAEKLTCGDRLDEYGPPTENMQRIADTFNALRGYTLSASDIAMVLLCVKLARLTNSPTHRDSHVDGMAYLGILYECAVAERAQKADLI